MKYAHVIHEEQSYDFKGTEEIEHQTVLQNTRPTNKSQYRVPYAIKDGMKSEVEKNAV